MSSDKRADIFKQLDTQQNALLPALAQAEREDIRQLSQHAEGTAGAQSATLMVRAIVTGDVELKDWIKLICRETLVALCLGITMAIAVSLLGFYRGGEMVAVVLALSMIGIVLLGC